VAVLRIEVDFCAAVDALLVSSRLTPAAALDRHKIEKALGEPEKRRAAPISRSRGGWIRVPGRRLLRFRRSDAGKAR